MDQIRDLGWLLLLNLREPEVRIAILLVRVLMHESIILQRIESEAGLLSLPVRERVSRTQAAVANVSISNMLHATSVSIEHRRRT